MWFFGDVWTTPGECRRLAGLIDQGLASGLATESRRAYLHPTSTGYEACILALALIGHAGGIIIATEFLDEAAHKKSEGAKVICQATGIGQELALRVVRWHLVEEMSAQGIVERLNSVKVVHALIRGAYALAEPLPLCGFTDEPLPQWPVGQEATLAASYFVTCPNCKEILARIKVPY